MYGTAIVCGSYTVLAMALFCHLCQMVFLAKIEEPHMEILYGSEFSKASVEWSECRKPPRPPRASIRARTHARTHARDLAAGARLERLSGASSGST